MSSSNGTEQSQALVLHQAPALAAYEPRNINEALQLAQQYASSGLNPQFKTQAQVMMIMATGAELNIPATAALRSLYVGPGGRVGMEVKLKIALCQRSKTCRYFRLIASTETEATYETLRAGDEEPVRVTFTLEDAKKAGLVKPDSQYVKYPRRQLRWRAAGELADMVYPELMLGIPSVEEMMDDVVDMRAPVATLDAETYDRKTGEVFAAAAILQTPPAETTDDLLKRWQAELKECKTAEQVDAITAEAKEKLTGGTPEQRAYQAMARERKDELKGKAGAQQTLVDADGK